MAALAANTSLVVGGRYLARPSPKSLIVKSGSTTYQGSLCGIAHATGHVVPLDDAADRSYCGISLNKIVGDGTLEGSINGLEFHADNVNVTGLTAQTNVPEPVYATTDNTLTLTRPADDAVPVGITTKYASSGVGSVLFFGHATAAALGMAGSDKEEITLGVFNLADFTATERIEHDLYGHGKIVMIRANPVRAATTGSKAATLTGNINASAITTGVLALTSANMTPSGTPLEAVPTAANEFYDGDQFNLVTSAVTAFVEGTVRISITVQRLP